MSYNFSSFPFFTIKTAYTVCIYTLSEAFNADFQLEKSIACTKTRQLKAKLHTQAANST